MDCQVFDIGFYASNRSLFGKKYHHIMWKHFPQHVRLGSAYFHAKSKSQKVAIPQQSKFSKKVSGYIRQSSSQNEDEQLQSTEMKQQEILNLQVSIENSQKPSRQNTKRNKKQKRKPKLTKASGTQTTNKQSLSFEKNKQINKNDSKTLFNENSKEDDNNQSHFQNSTLNQHDISTSYLTKREQLNELEYFQRSNGLVKYNQEVIYNQEQAKHFANSQEQISQKLPRRKINGLTFEKYIQNKISQEVRTYSKNQKPFALQTDKRPQTARQKLSLPISLKQSQISSDRQISTKNIDIYGNPKQFGVGQLKSLISPQNSKKIEMNFLTTQVLKFQSPKQTEKRNISQQKQQQSTINSSNNKKNPQKIIQVPIEKGFETQRDGNKQEILQKIAKNEYDKQSIQNMNNEVRQKVKHKSHNILPDQYFCSVFPNDIKQKSNSISNINGFKKQKKNIMIHILQVKQSKLSPESTFIQI